MFRYILFFLVSTIALAQTEQAWVFFTPKSFDDTVFDTPTNFLTDKAIARKNRHDIVIDQYDLPLDQNNIATISSQIGINYITQSKWFNAIYVSGTQTNIEALISFKFVDRVFFMNRSLNSSNSSKKINTLEGIHLNKLEEKSNFSYGSASTQINQINLAPLHNAGFTGKGMTIAVLDSGFENVDVISGFNRARNNGQILGGYDFPNRSDAIFEYKNSDHGTSVLSCMVGFIENEFVGTAPDTSYYVFRTEIAERESPEEEALWIAAAERADSLGVDVLNTSLGYTTFDEQKYNYSPSDMNGTTAFISQGVRFALQKGMIPVTSAGNTGNSNWRIISAPADSNAAFSIAAVNANGTKASFSAFGPTADNRIKPDVAAMGQGTTLFNDQGAIATSNGTSFSGPIVAGAITCLWQAFPNKKPIEIMNMVRESASQANNPNTNLGFGIANFGSAFDGTLFSSRDIANQTQSNNNLLNTIVANTLFINKNIVGNIITIYNLEGKRLFEFIALTNAIDVKNLPEGIYIFKPNSNENATIFIKE